MFDPALEGGIHRLKALAGSLPGEAEDHGHEQSGKALLLDESDAIRRDRLDQEAVLAVEQARDAEVPEPTQGSTRRDLHHPWPEAHALALGWLQADVEASAFLDRTCNLADEGIPFGIGGEVLQDIPDLIGRGGDFDFGSDLGRHWLLHSCIAG